MVTCFYFWHFLSSIGNSYACLCSYSKRCPSIARTTWRICPKGFNFL